MILIILGVVLAILGIFVMACPKSATKKENRENEAAIKKVKKMGSLYLILAIVLIAVGCFTGIKKEVNCSACGKKIECPWYSNSENNMCDDCFKNLERMFGN